MSFASSSSSSSPSSPTSSSPEANAPTVVSVRHPLFCLGRVVATPAALALLDHHAVEPVALLSRHVLGDWGQLDRDDVCANDEAVKHGGRVLSAYCLPLRSSREVPPEVHQLDRVWVITEADRSSTCLLLPSEY